MFDMLNELKMFCVLKHYLIEIFQTLLAYSDVNISDIFCLKKIARIIG